VNSITPADYATPEQIARNHARVAELRDHTRPLNFTEDLILTPQTISPPRQVQPPAADNQQSFTF